MTEQFLPTTGACKACGNPSDGSDPDCQRCGAPLADYVGNVDEEEGELPDTYRDNVDGHWYVVRYDRTLPQIHATDCVTCEDEDENECEGHESLAGAHMGLAIYCDGSCRS